VDDNIREIQELYVEEEKKEEKGVVESCYGTLWTGTIFIFFFFYFLTL